jgi:hypothetical protein
LQAGIDEDSVDRTVVVVSEQDSEIMDAKEQTPAKVTRSIVFVTGEAAPYAKSGGLGDVCGSLPIALAARGHRVMVVMPRYLNGSSDKNYAKAFYTGKHIKIPCFGGSHEVTFFHEYRDSVDWVGIQSPYYFLFNCNYCLALFTLPFGPTKTYMFSILVICLVLLRMTVNISMKNITCFCAQYLWCQYF